MFSAENLFRAIDLIPASVYAATEKRELKLPPHAHKKVS
jgi:hypothetical protein